MKQCLPELHSRHLILLGFLQDGRSFSFINYTVGPSEIIFLLRNCSEDIVYKLLTFKWPSCSITVVLGYRKPQVTFAFNCALLFSIVAECFSQFN